MPAIQEPVTVRHRLPGRLRLYLPALKSGRLPPAPLQAALQKLPGVARAEVRPSTGSVLLFYQPRSTSETDLIQQAGRLAAGPVPPAVTPAANTSPPARDFLRLAAGGAILGGLALKRVIAGEAPLARSPRVVNLAALVSVVAGYPLLRRGVTALARGRGLNADLLLAGASLSLLLLRESLPGLFILVLAEGLRLTEKMAAAQARTDLAAIAQGKEGSLRPPSLPPAVAAGVDRYGEEASKLTLGLAAATYLWRRDYRQALAMLVAGAPVATSLGETALAAAGIRQAVANGILAGDGRHFMALPSLDTMVWCQESIFVAGRPVIEEVYSLDPAYPRARLLTLAAAACREVAHPLGPALWHALQEQGLHAPRARKAELLPGGAVRAQIEQHEVTLAAPSALKGLKISARRGQARARRYLQTGLLPLYLVVDGRPAGLLAAAEQLKADAAAVIAGLRELGFTRQVLLSYGSREEAELLAARLGLDGCRSGAGPGEKAAVIRDLKDQGRLVAAVGRGEADEAALAAADFSLALGPPLAAADMLALSTDPARVLETFRLARRARALYRQDFLLVRAFNAIGLGLAFGRFFSPAAAMLWQDFLSLILLLNAGRLRWPGGGRARAEVAATRAAARRQEGERATLHPVPAPASVPAPQPAAVAQFPGWQDTPLPALLATLQVEPEQGLTRAEAARRLQVYGPNTLMEARPITFWDRVKGQLQNHMVRLLMGTSLVNVFMGKISDAATIMGIVALNAVLGAFQESQADEALRALRRLEVPRALVVRDGREQEVPAAELVPGDVILVSSGDRVPADARLLAGFQLEVEEASLTGESVPVGKNPRAQGNGAALFLGTSVTRGRGRAVVCATGMATEMGRIAAMLEEKEPRPTVLQQNLSHLGRRLMHISLGACGLMIVSGLLRGQGLLDMVLSGTSLAVAAIPEGLPAVATVSLAAGVQRMAQRRAIVRRMGAVEALGGVTVICSDKTGTLTKNQMTVRRIYTGRWWEVSGEGYNPEGTFKSADGRDSDEGLRLALMAAALCNEARLIEPAGAGESWQVGGDPTEAALLVAAAKAGLWPEDLKQKYPLRRMVPFESSRRRMLVACSGPEGGTAWVFAKGAPDALLDCCTTFLAEGRDTPLHEARRRFILQQARGMSAAALRVLAVAYKRCDPAILTVDDADLEASLAGDLTFAGLIGMYDPPRPEVCTALASCRQAGIEVKMITGDHPATARAIALELGLIEPDDRVVTSAELAGLAGEELAAVAGEARIFAQVLPRHKYELVRALKNQGHIVVMTGDGINDAPAVKEADIGIAMGQTGTDVTREAASLVISDDNFATIVAAVEEGRATFQNIRRSLLYLLATNAGEVVLMLAATMKGLPLPLLPLQLLWINLIGDGLPALALGVAPPAPDVMAAPPPGKQSFLTRDFNLRVLATGIASGLTSLFTFQHFLRTRDLATARTLTFTTLTGQQILYAYTCRPPGKPSRFLLASGAISAGLMGISVYWPLARRLFHTRPLNPGEWLATLPLMLLPAVTEVLPGMQNKVK
ncbi:MAG: P-type Ca2+ transporter type [Clostridia bacterium]|nr:P-type Ca2+ transporter type [Clostridia bacterium]